MFSFHLSKTLKLDFRTNVYQMCIVLYMSNFLDSLLPSLSLHLMQMIMIPPSIVIIVIDRPCLNMCSNGINDQSRSQFKCALENLDSYDLEHSISDNCSSPSQESMDSLWEKLNFTLIDTAKWLGICKVIPTPKLSNVVRNPIDKPWFDASCHDLKRE